MLVRLKSNNQIMLPESILSSLPKTEYFEVTAQDGVICLVPASVNGAAVRAKLNELGVTEADVADAVSWGRDTR